MFRGVSRRASTASRCRRVALFPRRRRAWRCSARSCPRSMRRARRRRVRSRRATSRRCFSAHAACWPGLVLLGAGAALAQLGPVGGLPLFGYAAIACLLVGAILLVPWLAAMRCFGICRCLAHPPLRAGARPAARRARAGGGEPRRDRRQLLADGGDGDHGGVVPPVGRRLAGSGAAGRALLPHHARRRHRPPRAGIRGARARAAAGRARRVPAQRPHPARPGAPAARADRARPRRASVPGRSASATSGAPAIRLRSG